MVEKLKALGIDIDWSRVQEIAGDGAIGRPHVARAMLEKGYIKTFEEAFEKYIGHGGPAYVEREKMTPEEAVALIVRSRGLPVLAHPFTVPDQEAMVRQLKPAGLVGIEAYYKDNSPENTAATLQLAKKYGLIATGGTDYHGIGENKEVMMGAVEVPLEAARDLIDLAEKRKMTVRKYLYLFQLSQCSWCRRFYTGSPQLCRYKRLQSNCPSFEVLTEVKGIWERSEAIKEWESAIIDLMQEVEQKGIVARCRNPECLAFNPNPAPEESACWLCGSDTLRCPEHQSLILRYNITENCWKCPDASHTQIFHELTQDF